MDRRASQTLDTESLNGDTPVPNGSFSEFNIEESSPADEGMKAANNCQFTTCV